MMNLGWQEKAGAPDGVVPAVESGKRPLDLGALGLQLQAIFGSRFEVLEPVALGGMAVIFQLRHRLHGGLFVAKVIHPELAQRPEVISSFRSEALHAARLAGHPNAVPVFDFGDLDGILFLIMPYVEGEDLDRLLATCGPLSRPEALGFAAQISSLLCHAESYGITHCDLAPGNIRLDIFGRYRVLDLGLSHWREGMTPYAPLGGTPLYNSPEQIRGEVPDIRTDIYALGAILCEVLTGKPLFQAESLAAVKDRHLRGKWELPPEVAGDPVLAKLITRMLAMDREDRLSSAFELSGALSAMGFERPEFRQAAPAAQPYQNEAAGRRKRLSAD